MMMMLWCFAAQKKTEFHGSGGDVQKRSAYLSSPHFAPHPAHATELAGNERPTTHTRTRSSTAAQTCPESDMNPYAANFQVPVVPAGTAGTTTVVGPGQDGEANDQSQEAAWAEDPSQSADGAGGYWDENGQHHPGYGGEYDPAAYHPDGYHQVCNTANT